MITPSGRFEPGMRICLSISDYHPESWNPAWKTESILIALISFMNSDETAVGCVNSSLEQKKDFAK